jgi:oxygen-dependent protoporphyrinogen oxidase
VNLIIVGAGISGLATAYALRRRDPGLRFSLLESTPRTGGKVWTEHSAEGYALEWGVNGFLNNKPRTLELAAELGLHPLQGAADAARRYVYRHQSLHRLPESPPAFLRSRLLSLSGRFRVMLEPFIARGHEEDESLADFTRRRLGEEALQALIDPMASGVFAGDPERMSLKSCFPRIHEIEQTHGSLIRGMLHLQREARRAGRGPGPGPGPSGTLTSFPGGMSELTDRLAAGLGDVIRLESAVESVSRTGSGYALHLAGGETREAERVILAAPAWAQAVMLRELAPDLAGLLAGIEYPPLAVVCLAYRADRLPAPPDGFGFLVPGSEGRNLLGTIFDSNVFPGRAPDGHVLMRSMVGGSRAPALALRDDEQLLDSVRAEFSAILGIHAEPEFARVVRHRRAIPQYHVGHSQRLRDIETALRTLPGLHLTGNAFHGVSLNDCIANALALTEKFPGDTHAGH